MALLRATACLVENFMTRRYIGTMNPPPPIPPHAAIINPNVHNNIAHKSSEFNGKSDLCGGSAFTLLVFANISSGVIVTPTPALFSDVVEVVASIFLVPLPLAIEVL